jgi:uncharacterized RDD family membrane protein YckC
MAVNIYETTRYALADIGTRFEALLIDALILSAISGLSFVGARGLGLSLSFLIVPIYYWFFLTRNNGQTPGKRLMKIRVIKANGASISDSDAVIRYIGYVVNNFFFIGWAWALFDDNRQGWHDKIAETYVVKSE